MEPQSSVSLLQLGGLMAGLLLLGLLLLGTSLVLTRRRKASNAKHRLAGQQPPPERRPGPAPTPTSASPAPRRPTEVLRVYQDPRDGSLIIQLDGARYRTLGDIKQAGIEKPFLAILRELARLAKDTGDQVSNDLPAAPPLPSPPPPAPLLPSLEELTGRTPAPQDNQPIGTFFGNVRRMIPGSPSNVALEPPSGIADQIEAILQLKLLSSEQYRGQGIHVRSAPGGGVQIEVGQRVYEGVGDIEDEGIRAFVQSAIQDWERQQT